MDTKDENENEGEIVKLTPGTYRFFIPPGSDIATRTLARGGLIQTILVKDKEKS